MDDVEPQLRPPRRLRRHEPTYPDGGIIAPDPTAVLEIDVLVLTGNAPFTTTDVSVDTVGISDG